MGDFNYLQATEGGTLTASVGSNPDRIHDGTPGNYWQSGSYVFNSTLSFSFDTDMDGVSGAAGDVDDLFTLRQLNIYNRNSSTDVEKFQVEVKTATNSNWTKLISSIAPVGDFNYLQATEGGTLTASVGSNPDRIHDGTPGNYWQSSSFSLVNELEFSFDVDMDGTSAAAGDVDDLFTLRQFNIYNRNSSTDVETFEVEVKTLSNPVWTLVAVSGSTTITALRNTSKQVFFPDVAVVDVTEVRLRTLSNYGNSVTRIAEFEVIGDAVGPSHTFIAQRSTAKQSYLLDTPVADITELRLVTLDNYGNTVTRIAEFEVIGDAVGPSHTFIAQRTTAKQIFALGNAVDNVTDVRLITLDNYGNTVTRIADFGVAGTTSGPAYVFTAQRSDAVQRYVLSGDSARLFRFHSFDNYGNTVTRIRALALESTLCLAGYWAMDEVSWNGSAAEVVDIGGNDLHGTSFNGAATASINSALPGNPGTCGYGEFDGANDYVQIPHSTLLNGDTSLTYAAWINPDTWNGGIRQIMAKSVHGGGSGRGQMGIFSESGVLKGRAETTAGRREISTSLPSTGNWHHVALVFTDTELVLYVDGNNAASTTFSSTQLVTNTDPLNISKRVGTNQYYFDGLIDEVRVYLLALDATDIQTIMAETHPCGAGIDHFLITHDGQGISCAAEAVTVSAHALDHSVFSSYSSNIILDTGTGNGSWSLISGAGTFIDATLGDGIASYQFDASDNGIAQFALDYQQGVSPINIAVGDGSFLDDDTEGLLNFSPSGFIVTATQLANPPPNPINDPLGNQTAGTNFNMWLTAYGQSVTDPSCGVIESYTGVKPINFWNSTINPATGTITPTVAGSPIAATEGTSSVQNVMFNNGQAQLLVKYKDVGQIRINLKDAELVTKANVITGSSSNFVVKPADFVISLSANPAANDANGGVFKKAGEAFQVDVAVVDAEGSLTPNYGNENSPETIKISSSQLIAPLAGRNGSSGTGALLNATAFTATAPGQFSNITAAFDEVGIIRMQAEVGDEDYIGSGNVSGTESGNVGRFIPDRFLANDNSPQFRNGDSAWSCGFSYQQQPFEFATGLQPILTITAVNETGAATFNYGGDFWKLNTTASGRDYQNQAVGVAAVLNADTSSSTVTLSATSDLADGEGTVTISGDLLSYQKSAATPVASDAPFAADAVLTLTVADLTDSDNVCYDSDNDGNCDNYVSSNINGTEIRWGRWYLENGFGSELEALPIIAIAQQFDGTLFQVNTDDNCSATTATWLAPTLSSYSDNLNAGETVLTQSTMTAGILPLMLSAPGEGNYGSVRVVMPTDSWLYYDFDGDGSADAASATATFGIFKGKSPVIYWRQKY